MNKIDIIALILSVIITSIVLGLNVVSIIDKKISNISVNIPQIKLPEQNIILHVNKDTENNNITICPSSINKKDEKDEKETFIVADAQNFQEYTEIKKRNDGKLDHHEIDNPEIKDIVDYNVDDYIIQTSYNDEKKESGRNKNYYITPADFGFEEPQRFTSCENSSIAEKRKFGQHSNLGILKSRGNNSVLPNQIACGSSDKIKASDYWKIHYKPQVLPLEDYKVRGYNYMDYSNKVRPHNIDFKILSQASKGIYPKDSRLRNIPTSSNYAFHDSPSMRYT